MQLGWGLHQIRALVTHPLIRLEAQIVEIIEVSGLKNSSYRHLFGLGY